MIEATKTKLTLHQQRAILFIFFIFVTAAAALLLPDTLGNDWRYVLRPAIIDFFGGKNPYEVEQFFIAPWVLIFLAPLSMLPEKIGMALLFGLGLGTYAYVAVKLKATPVGTIAILLSPQVMHNLINGNIDWLAFLGFVFPPQIGIFFLALKPQIGLALAVFWAIDAIRKKTFIRTIGPFFLVLLLSFIPYGIWPLNFQNVQPEYNASAWPLSLPFGVFLLISAVSRTKERIAQAISPLLSPHVMFHSWATMLYALAPNTFELIIAVTLSWLFCAWSAIS